MAKTKALTPSQLAALRALVDVWNEGKYISNGKRRIYTLLAPGEEPQVEEYKFVSMRLGGLALPTGQTSRWGDPITRRVSKATWQKLADQQLVTVYKTGGSSMWSGSGEVAPTERGIQCVKDGGVYEPYVAPPAPVKTDEERHAEKVRYAVINVERSRAAVIDAIRDVERTLDRIKEQVSNSRAKAELGYSDYNSVAEDVTGEVRQGIGNLRLEAVMRAEVRWMQNRAVLSELIGTALPDAWAWD